jgi:hypothetical protein
LITDSAALAAQQMRTPSTSDDAYHQSQKASRGAGKITQTETEQQWESELINDAEFTANAQLPSVTFDVNNSYVARQLGQRVGEEVSHFYHPTPPPRNPSGFWQRVEQRYKNDFERQALIAEGRASAYSEVMYESIGHAAANEQNYLDIGYTDSAAQTRAGWIAAIELPLPSVAKGIMQASSLMNRWGLFSQGAESSLLPVKATKLGDFDAYNPGLLTRRPASSFLGQRYSSFRLDEDLILYRAGSDNQSLGEYFSLDRPDSELQLRIDKAVRPSWPDGGKSIIDTTYQVKIPKGVNVHIGEVAPQGDIFLGGTQQIFIQKPWLISGVEILNKYPLKEELLWNPSLR